MLAQRADRSEQHPSFSRRDLGRLLAAAGLLILALTAVFAVDVVPTRVDVKVGDVATADILAPRAITYTSDLQTEAARAAARAAVAPQYSYTLDKASAVARQQELAFERSVAAVDTAFDPATLEKDRIGLLETALPGLSDESRANLMALPLSRWPVIRAECARVLDQLEASELRDADLAEVRARLAGRILGGLNEAERKLSAEIVAPLLIANSDYDQAATDAARDQAAALVAPIRVAVSQGQAIVRKGDPVTAADIEQINAFGLTTARWDLARLAGWALLSTLLVGLLLAWVWRFRPDLWHRTNVLALVGLLLVFASFALELTAGRLALPFIVPTAAVGILVALLLDAGTAIVLTAVIAVVAGAVNGNSLEMTAYVFFGGAAGIVAIPHGATGSTRSSRPGSRSPSSTPWSWRPTVCSASAT